MGVETVIEPEPAGTGGALARAGDRLDELFFLVNGDSLFDCNWLALRPAARDDPQGTARMTLAGGIHGSRYGPGGLDGDTARAVTPQAGVAHGYYDEEAIQLLHGWMRNELSAEGAHIDTFEYCPFHPGGVVAKYCQDSDFRKPGAGMLKKLMADWPVDAARSLLIGDRQTDLEAAAAAGIRSHLFTGGNLLSVLKPLLTA